MKSLSFALLVLLLVACRAEPAPSLSDLDRFVLEQAAHCELWGRPTEEAEQMGIPITDCDYYIEEAEKIHTR